MSTLLNTSVFGVLAVAFVGDLGDEGLDLLAVASKFSLLAQNVVFVGFFALISQFTSCVCVGHVITDGVTRVCTSHGQEVLRIDEDTTLLHDSEWSFRASLLNIPYEFVFNALLATTEG